MGKIRVKALGDEKKEQEQKKKAQQKAEAKRLADEAKAKAEAAKEPVKKDEAKNVETTQAEKTEGKQEEKKKVGKTKFQSKKKQGHSQSYTKISTLVDKNKKYSLKEALDILPKLKRAKFDETVELHINTMEKSVSGSLTLPHGTGKQTRIEIVSQAQDPKHVEEVVKKVEAGTIDFDILIATPDTMPKLAKVARFLGPKGLMPNPKNGTVTPKPQEVAKKFQGGQVNFKTEAKFPIIHMSVGKVSFGDKKLSENIEAALTAVQSKNIKNITLKSTMSPGIKIDSTNIA